MKKPDPLEHIVYISLPENFSHTIGSFTVNPAVLIPVEISEDDPEISIQNLSWEMIVSGMLKVLAYNPTHKDSGYYRDFVYAVKPDIVYELSQVGILKARNKDFEIAEEIFTVLKNLDPGNIHHTLNLALAYQDHAAVCEKIGNQELAEEYRQAAFDEYKIALASAPDNQDVNYHAGYFFLKQGNFARAKELFSFYLKIASNTKKAKHVQGILEEISRYELDDRLFSEAYDFIRLGKEEEAITRITEYLERHPDVWNAWFLLGWANRRLSRFAEGEKAFLKAIELKADVSDVFNECAICQMELGKYDESRLMLNKALSMEPENIKIISNLGILSLKEGKREDARGFFETVLEIEPQDPIAKKYLEFMQKQ